MGLLRRFFGPSIKESWGQLCREIGGQYIESGFWKRAKVQIPCGPWTVTLDTYSESSGDDSTIYTRMRAPYVAKDGFRFTMYRKTVFSGLGELLGMRDVQVG